MQPLSIGEVCEVLGLKPHILRYWEQEIPLLSPPKDSFGRREFHERELQQLFRIKYLVYTKKYTVQGVARRLLQEASGRSADAKARVHAVRHAVLGSVYRARAVTDRLSQLGVPRQAIDPTRVDETTQRELSEAAVHTLRRELQRYPETLWDDLQAVLASPSLGPDGATDEQRGTVSDANTKVLSLPEHEAFSAECGRRGLEALAEGTVLAFSPVSNACPAPDAGYPPLAPLTALRRVSLLELTAERLRAASYACGRRLVWVIVVPHERLGAVRAYIKAKRRFGFRKGDLVVAPQQTFPLLYRDGTAVAKPDGTIVSYWSGLAGSFRILSSPAFARFCGERGLERVLFAPLDNPVATVPASTMLGLHLSRGNAYTFEVVAQRGRRFRPSGAAVVELDAIGARFPGLPLDHIEIPAASLGLKDRDTDNPDRSARDGIRLKLRLSRLLQKEPRSLAVECDRRAAYAPLTRIEELPSAAQALSRYDAELIGGPHSGEACEVPPLFAQDAETAKLRQALRAGGAASDGAASDGDALR